MVRVRLKAHLIRIIPEWRRDIRRCVGPVTLEHRVPFHVDNANVHHYGPLGVVSQRLSNRFLRPGGAPFPPTSIGNAILSLLPLGEFPLKENLEPLVLGSGDQLASTALLFDANLVSRSLLDFAFEDE